MDVEKTGKDNQKNQPYKDFIKFLKLFYAVLVREAGKYCTHKTSYQNVSGCKIYIYVQRPKRSVEINLSRHLIIRN